MDILEDQTDTAPLIPSASTRELVVGTADNKASWVAVNGRWYPTQPRTAVDTRLAMLSVLIPALPIALKYGMTTKKFLIALVLTTLLYFPGLFYSLWAILIEPRRPSEDQLEAAPYGYVYGTDIPMAADGDVLNYAALDPNLELD